MIPVPHLGVDEGVISGPRRRMEATHVSVHERGAGVPVKQHQRPFCRPGRPLVHDIDPQAAYFQTLIVDCETRHGSRLRARSVEASFKVFAFEATVSSELLLGA